MDTEQLFIKEFKKDGHVNGNISDKINTFLKDNPQMILKDTQLAATGGVFMALCTFIYRGAIPNGLY